MSKRAKSDPNFGKLREWQDHQYDPGYWSFGRMRPLWRSAGGRGGPNPFGYILLLGGIVTLAGALIQLISALLASPTHLGTSGTTIIFLSVFGAFQIFAAMRLLDKRAARATSARPRRRPKA